MVSVRPSSYGCTRKVAKHSGCLTSTLVSFFVSFCEQRMTGILERQLTCITTCLLLFLAFSAVPTSSGLGINEGSLLFVLLGSNVR